MAATGATAIKPSVGVHRDALEREISGRREQLGAALEAAGIDAVVVASEANCQYLTGYETTFWGNKSKPFAVVCARGHQPVVVCHTGEAPSVALDAIDIRIETYGAPVDIGPVGAVQLDYQEPAADIVARVVDDLGVAVVGLELSWHFLPGFTPRAYDHLRSRMHQLELRDASAEIWAVRRRKTAWEMHQMQVASGVAIETHRVFQAVATAGMTERELNRLLIRGAYDAGAEKIGYSGIVAGVDRVPLGGPTDRRWELGQLLMADICLQVNGYFADFNRIYSNTEPSPSQATAYGEVVDALARGRERVAAGLPIGELARALAGGQRSLYDRVGHGLGLEMPEPPSLSSVDPTPLLEGEVLCLEPNVLADGVGWLVSEEEIVVTEGGYRLLSPPFPEQIAVVGATEGPSAVTAT